LDSIAYVSFKLIGHPVVAQPRVAPDPPAMGKIRVSPRAHALFDAAPIASSRLATIFGRRRGYTIYRKSPNQGVLFLIIRLF
jgi:hypothetical protein